MLLILRRVGWDMDTAAEIDSETRRSYHTNDQISTVALGYVDEKVVFLHLQLP